MSSTSKFNNTGTEKTGTAENASYLNQLSYTWQPLRLLNLYRLTLSGLFVVLIVLGNEPIYFGNIDRELATFGSGLGVLLVVAIAGGSVIMASRMANLFAAVATITILFEEG